MFKKIVFPLFAAALLVWAIGCSDNPSEPQIDADLPNINDDFGGYAAVDEAPGFGDPELIAMEGDEEEVDDALLSSPVIQDWIVNPNVLAFHFRAIWGQLTYDSMVTTPTDWTGSLTISRGGVITRRLICWELNQDFLLPRTTREVVEWQSTTTVHHDGLAFDLMVPWVTSYDTTVVVDTIDDTTFDTTYLVDTIVPEPFTLTFAIGPYTRTFDMEELAALDTIVYVDDADSNAVVFQGYQKFRTVCPRGILSGRWGYDEEGNGIFRGVWHSRFGYVDGYLSGTFGVNDQDEQVFYGKWIDRDGRFEGLLAGYYGLHPNTNASETAKRRAGGWLKGRIFDASESAIGELKGRFKSNTNFPAGWFQARWKLDCSDVPEVDENLGALEDAI
jgi:hypothetical protein